MSSITLGHDIVEYVVPWFHNFKGFSKPLVSLPSMFQQVRKISRLNFDEQQNFEFKPTSDNTLLLWLQLGVVYFEFWASCVRCTLSVWCPCPIGWWICTSRRSRRRWYPSSRRRSQTCRWLEAASGDLPPISHSSHSPSLKVVLWEFLAVSGMRCFSIMLLL